MPVTHQYRSFFASPVLVDADRLQLCVGDALTQSAGGVTVTSATSGAEMGVPVDLDGVARSSAAASMNTRLPVRAWRCAVDTGVEPVGASGRVMLRLVAVTQSRLAVGLLSA